ncbi:MAG: methyltransferase type 11, partial [Gammaproteobacteria bacterium]
DFDPPAVLATDGVQILVAGCGTGQEPIALGRAHPTSQVLGMDLSRASLAYGVRAAKRFAVKNVRFLHGDILALGGMEQRFHVVTASGVIHHMARPQEGLAALVDRLHPGGVIKLGLYSEQARQAVIAARAEIDKADLRPIPEDIRKLRERILSSKASEEVRELSASEDLYALSGTRDLLFHVCEHRYTLAALGDLLARFGLVFLGFELINPLARQRYAELAPTDRGLADLGIWEKVERRYPDTFAAMYQFWCQKPAS